MKRYRYDKNSEELVEKKDCIHFEVCNILGSGCGNWESDPCVYYKK